MVARLSPLKIRFQIDNNRWQKLPSGPSARYKAPMAAYQRHILVVGGITNETEKSDIWGFHLDLNQWLPWVRNIPRQINGFGFVKNDVFYCVGEARKSNYVMIYGYDLVERKLHNFYHKLPVSKNHKSIVKILIFKGSSGPSHFIFEIMSERGGSDIAYVT